MTRILAVVRRVFLGGTVSLLLLIFLFQAGLPDMFHQAAKLGSAQGMFSIFFLSSPIMYLLLVFFSVAYIRKRGQFAAAHQNQPVLVTFLRCCGHDIIAPLKNVRNFISALRNKDAMGRERLIGRFIGMLILIAVCEAGILLVA